MPSLYTIVRIIDLHEIKGKKMNVHIIFASAIALAQKTEKKDSLHKK